MNRRLPPLGSLRAFEAAARRESFKDAAAELGVTPTAISHQIRQLEEELGVALFARSPRKVTLTPKGEALYPPLKRAFDEMAQAVDDARRKPARRVATLSATVAFTAKLLVPKAARFRAMHPEWDLRLHASDEAVDLHAGEADAAIRYGVSGGAGLDRLPMMTDEFAAVASPHLGLSAPADLRSATLLHFDWRGGGTVPTWRRWASAAGLDGLEAEAGIAFNDEASVIEAAIAGQGVALASLALIQREIASGLLVAPFGPRLQGWRYDFVFPEGGEARPAVLALRSWIEAEVLGRPF